jgi:hypothetical protein
MIVGLYGTMSLFQLQTFLNIIKLFITYYRTVTLLLVLLLGDIHIFIFIRVYFLAYVFDDLWKNFHVVLYSILLHISPSSPMLQLQDSV